MTARTAEAAADRIAESLANESNLVLSDRDTAILRRHLRAFAEANRHAPLVGSVESAARPDFGEDRQEWNGTVLTCKRIAPGLTLHDLVMAFDRGESEAQPGDDAAGNPSRWPVIRGIKAVTNTILDAVYGSEGRAVAASRAPPPGSVEAVARTFYEAWVHYRDVNLPRWEQLRDREQGVWCLATTSALTALPPTTLADVPPIQRAALRLAIDYALDDVRPTDLVRGDVRDALRAVLARLEAI